MSSSAQSHQHASGTTRRGTGSFLTWSAAALPAFLCATHLHVPVGEQQVHDDVGAQQLHAVQPPLQASQLLPQLLPAEALPGPPDVLPDGLPEVATEGPGRGGREGGGEKDGACPSARPVVPSPASSWCPSLYPITKSRWAWSPAAGPAGPPGA